MDDVDENYMIGTSTLKEAEDLLKHALDSQDHCTNHKTSQSSKQDRPTPVKNLVEVRVEEVDSDYEVNGNQKFDGFDEDGVNDLQGRFFGKCFRWDEK
jgi:hypothetical protein